MRTQKKLELHKRRHWRIRKKVKGSAARPRMSVAFTGENIYVQFIDDVVGKTLASTSTKSKAVENREKLSANVKSAEIIGKIAAENARSVGIEGVVFDRGGNRYHGKLKALADAAREAGLQF